MACGKGTLKWKRAMAITRRNYPNLGLKRRKRIAGAIVSRSRR